jgi:hypothetical protein
MTIASEGDGKAGLAQLLSRSRQGRLLKTHLACVSVKLCNNTFDSSMRQCASMRRAVLEALRKKERLHVNPFRLPTDLPKSIVVANLAGDHVMLYETSGYSLIRQFLTVVTVPGKRQLVSGGVDSMAQFADGMVNRCLLLVYSMPPLEDPSAMHWELRSVTVDGGKVLDGARHFARNALEPCFATPTGETTEPALLRAETAALQNNVVAESVDMELDAAEEACPLNGVEKSAWEIVYRNTIEALQADRKQLVSEIRSMSEDRVQNMENERALARKECEKEIAVARTCKLLAEKTVSDAGTELASARKELKSAKVEIQEMKTSMARMELTQDQEKETLKRNRALYEKEKRDMRAAKDRAESRASETLRTAKAEYENLKFDSDARIRRLDKEAVEFKRVEQSRKEMHDKVVACMAGQDAELEVLKARVAECELTIQSRDESVESLHTEACSTNTALKVMKSEIELSESVGRSGYLEWMREGRAMVECRAMVEKMARVSAALVEVQQQLCEEQRENTALKERLSSATRPTTRSREAQTTMTDTSGTADTADTATVGTDTYIDVAQRSKTTQTAAEYSHVDPVNVLEASKRTFEALSQLVAFAQLPPSEYVMQSGVHPPARRCKLVKKDAP